MIAAPDSQARLWPAEAARLAAPEPANWIAVASAEHVRIGRAQGFMQVCHGKAAPLRRLRAGDRVAYYSPSEAFRGRDRLQAFTAIGVVAAGDPYQADMGQGFRPFRRDVHWFDTAQTAPIVLLLDRLSFSAGRRHWGYALRFGLFAVSARDMDLIVSAMQATPAPAAMPAIGLPVPQCADRAHPMPGALPRRRSAAECAAGS